MNPAKQAYFDATYSDKPAAFRLGYFAPADLLGYPSDLNQKSLQDLSDYKEGRAARRQDRAEKKF